MASRVAPRMRSRSLSLGSESEDGFTQTVYRYLQHSGVGAGLSRLGSCRLDRSSLVCRGRSLDRSLGRPEGRPLQRSERRSKGGTYEWDRSGLTLNARLMRTPTGSVVFGTPCV